MALLEVRGANVRFGGHAAVRDVDLDVEPGVVTGLIGPNGAGKTTLFNVITGLQETVSGKVILDGKDISRLKAHQRARRGIARTFQRLEVFGSLTARENILAAAEIRRGWSRDRSIDPKAEADRLLERIGITQVAHERVDAMPTGLARLVELGRALATRPQVLLLDEPASGLDDSESESFAQLLVELARGGHRGAAGRARRAPRDAGVRTHPRPRLRRHPRGRLARGDPAEPGRARRLPRRVGRRMSCRT